VCDTAIVVTHDLELTKTVADRVAVLIDGRFAAVGNLDDVLGSRDPARPGHSSQVRQGNNERGNSGNGHRRCGW
jgi:ABC-type glutathione transport system ATPase component